MKWSGCSKDILELFLSRNLSDRQTFEFLNRELCANGSFYTSKTDIGLLENKIETFKMYHRCDLLDAK